MGPGAVLPQVNPLPGAKRQPAFPDGDGEFAASENGANVGGHIIGTFHAVGVGWVAVRRKLADEVFQVPADVWIGILSNQQGCAGVSEEHMAQPNGNATLGYHVLQLLTDFVKSSARRGNFQGGGIT